jgi:hypothetical protein
VIKLATFLKAFRNEGELVHVRAFKPKKAADTPLNRPARWAATIADITTNRVLQDELIAKNQHCGLYFVVNVGGDTDAEITRFTAWFAENDKTPIAEQHAKLDACPIQPSIRVETKSSVHAYWLGDSTETQWRDIQSRLIHYFDGDVKIKNPSRVMRLPNFDHLHLNGNGPERKKVVVHTFQPDRRYTVEQMQQAFPSPPAIPVSATLGPAGPFEYHEDRHAELCQRIMSRGKRNSKGNWDARALCHNGSGDKGLVYFPASGAVVCNADPQCDYFTILRTEGLSNDHLPSRETTKQESETPTKVTPTKTPAAVDKPTYMTRSAPELLELEFAPLRWAILTLLSEGLFILAGRPKLGKSWLVLNFAIAVACGGYALGILKAEPGDVLCAALEDGARRLQERLRKLLGAGPIPENLEIATEWRPFDRGGLEDLELWLTEHPKARLVVFDTLQRVRPSEDPKARLYASDYGAVQGLQEISKRFGVSILVVHHTRKAAAEDYIDLTSGSTGLTGAADGVIILQRVRGKADATLSVTARDFPENELALSWDSELCNWRALGDASDYRMSEARREILELLRRSDGLGLKPKEISTELRKDYGATKKLLFDMRQADLVRSDEKGRYTIIDNGESASGPTATRGDRVSKFVPPESWSPQQRADWYGWEAKDRIA